MNALAKHGVIYFILIYNALEPLIDGIENFMNNRRVYKYTSGFVLWVALVIPPVHGGVMWTFLHIALLLFFTGTVATAW